jgi:hypothetical protein
MGKYAPFFSLWKAFIKESEAVKNTLKNGIVEMFLKNLNAQQVFHFRRSGSPNNAIPPQKVISHARSHRRCGRGNRHGFLLILPVLFISNLIHGIPM